MGRQFTREVSTALEAKLTIRIEPDDNANVGLLDTALGYGVTLDPKAANQIGHFLIQAARIAAMNTLDPPPQPRDADR
jgi:hypothetical protein